MQHNHAITTFSFNNKALTDEAIRKEFPWWIASSANAVATVVLTSGITVSVMLRVLEYDETLASHVTIMHGDNELLTVDIDEFLYDDDEGMERGLDWLLRETRLGFAYRERLMLASAARGVTGFELAANNWNGVRARFDACCEVAKERLLRFYEVEDY